MADTAQAEQQGIADELKEQDAAYRRVVRRFGTQRWDARMETTHRQVQQVEDLAAAGVDTMTIAGWWINGDLLPADENTVLGGEGGAGAGGCSAA